MIKWIEGLVDLIGINDVIFEKTKNIVYNPDTQKKSKPFHYDIEYYDLKDRLGMDELKEKMTYCTVKGDLGLYQLALKASGATSPIECKKLIEANIIKDARIKTIYNGTSIVHKLYIEGFSPYDALCYIGKNEFKENFHIMKVYEVTDNIVGTTRELKINNSIENIPPIAHRNIVAIKQDLHVIKDNLRMLQQEKSNTLKNSSKELEKILVEVEEIKHYTDRYLQETSQENENQEDEEER